VYGLAAIVFGIITLGWHDFNTWQQIRALGNVPHREILVYLAAAIEIFGGVAIQWTGTARIGAFALGFIYLVFALFWVPHIVAEPRVFDRWGNFFEQFSLVSGALIVYASPNPRVRNNRQHWLDSDTYSSESVLFPSRSNSSFIFLEPLPSFSNGFLRAK
jgi:uncharacterized membrane protein YphA (DoxX/SURF4 family)